MTFHFVITLCIKDDIQLRQALRCLDSIRKLHQNAIYILNDTEEEMFETVKHHFVKYNNTYFRQSYKKGLGEQQVFQFIMDCSDIQENDNVIYLHDSTILFLPFSNTVETKDLQFLWYYSQHRFHWDTIYQEQTPYNIEHKIHTHTDLLAHHLNKYYTKNPYFLSWALDSLKNKEKYVGCLGYMCIIKKRSLRELDKTVPFIKEFLNFNTKKGRIINEDIFSLICNYYYSLHQCIHSYDGLYYDGIDSAYRCKETLVEGIEDQLLWVCKGDCMGKISFGR